MLGPRSRRELSTQLAEQREELLAFAESVGCRRVARRLLAPARVARLGPGISQLSFGDLASAGKALSAEQDGASDPLDAVLPELTRAGAITKHSHRDYRRGVPTQDLYTLAPSCFVGVDGLAARGVLDAEGARRRSRWTVTEHDHRSRPNWRGLGEILRLLDGAAAGR